MKQIDANQIIDNGMPENTIKAIPRDLSNLKASSISGLNQSNFGQSDQSTNEAPVDNGSFPNTTPIALPDTPALIGVVSQNVKIKEDGTYTVDLIIEVEDIKNVTDYEVRISKGAGTV